MPQRVYNKCKSNGNLSIASILYAFTRQRTVNYATLQ